MHSTTLIKPENRYTIHDLCGTVVVTDTHTNMSVRPPCGRDALDYINSRGGCPKDNLAEGQDMLESIINGGTPMTDMVNEAQNGTVPGNGLRFAAFR
jgi:hypothetical protein